MQPASDRLIHIDELDEEGYLHILSVHGRQPMRSRGCVRIVGFENG